MVTKKDEGLLEEFLEELDKDEQVYAIPEDTSILPYVCEKLLAKAQPIYEKEKREAVKAERERIIKYLKVRWTYTEIVDKSIGDIHVVFHLPEDWEQALKGGVDDTHRMERSKPL